MKKGVAKILMPLIALTLLFSVASAEVFTEPLVKSIVIKGNYFVDSDIIEEALLKTQLDEPLEEQKVLDDLHAIYDLGFFQDVSANYESLDEGVEVIFYVLENPMVKDVSFNGPKKIPFAEYAKSMRTQPGYILNVHDLGEDLDELLEWVVNEHGYFVRITDLQADIEGHIEVELAETKIKDVVIEGNEKTKDFVIERELTFQPGDPVNLKQIEQSLRRILMLGFFEEIGQDFSTEEDPDETVLTINVKERKTGSATFGVAYSPADKFVGFIEAADENFLGRGQRINANVELGKSRHSYELGFYEPYIEKGGTSLGVNLYRRVRDVKKKIEDSDEKLKGSLTIDGGDLTLGRPMGEFSRGRLTFKMANNKYKLDPEAEPTDFYSDYKNRTVGFGINTNTVDHPMYPTEGFKNDAYLEAGVLIESAENNKYAKLRLEHSRFYEVKEGGYVLAFRAMGGRLLGQDLPENEKFVIGGADTLRGYSLGANSSLKGNQMLVMNAEFRFPIVDKVTGVVFSDFGKAWDSGIVTLDNLNTSFGLGVRLDTPLGLLRLDYGFGKDEQKDLKGQFYFGIGQTF